MKVHSIRIEILWDLYLMVQRWLVQWELERASDDLQLTVTPRLPCWACAGRNVCCSNIAAKSLYALIWNRAYVQSSYSAEKMVLTRANRVYRILCLFGNSNMNRRNQHPFPSHEPEIANQIRYLNYKPKLPIAHTYPFVRPA